MQSSFLTKYEKKGPARSENRDIDFEKLKKEKEESFINLAQGEKDASGVAKTSLVFLCPEGSEDPIETWYLHKNLQEKSWYTIPCACNFGKKCVVCNTVDELKEENLEANKFLYLPIDRKEEYYARVKTVDENNKLSAKTYWVRIPQTVMSAFVQHFKTLEKDETCFYERGSLQKVVITYDSTKQMAQQYAVTFKTLKAQPSSEKIDEWVESMKPLTHFFPARREESVVKLVEDYITRKVQEADDSENE